MIDLIWRWADTPADIRWFTAGMSIVCYQLGRGLYWVAGLAWEARKRKAPDDTSRP